MSAGAAPAPAGMADTGACGNARHDARGSLATLARLAHDDACRAHDSVVRHAARRCLLDWLGVAIAGWDEAPARAVRALFGLTSHSPLQAMVDAGVPIEQAALALGTAGHALDYDDTDYVNLIHVSATLFPALLPLAARGAVSGSRLLDVVATAFEAEDRLGAELGRKLTARGWHVSGVIGRFGAALGSGLLLDLPPPALAHAMAIAATGASGLIAAFGTMSKPLQLARGAADGVVAARLAAHGFTGPLEVLDAAPGFGVPYIDETAVDWSSIARDWGRPYAIAQRNAFKPHASCMITHPIVDAAIALRATLGDRGLALCTVQRIECRVNPLAPHVAGHARPATGLQGKFSVAYCCVAGLVLGHARPDAFSAATLRREDMEALVDRVTVVPDEAVGEQQALIRLTLDDGRPLVQAVDIAKGNPANPMSDDELAAKFLHLATPGLGTHASELARTLRDLDSEADVGAWLTRAPAGAQPAKERIHGLQHHA